MTETRERLTTDIEVMVALDESGNERYWDPATGNCPKARCPAKQLRPELGARGVRTYDYHSVLTVTAAESEEIEDGDLVVQPGMDAAIAAGVDCAWRVVARGAPYEAGGEVNPLGIPVGSDGGSIEYRQPSPSVEKAPRGSYVTLKVIPGTVDADCVEEDWRGELRVKPGYERWIPGRFRRENADAYMGTAKALGFDPQAAKAGKA